MQLYALLSSGHDGLAFNVDARGPALSVIDADGKRRPVRVGGEDVPPWQRARELHDGIERDRRFNAWVLERHLAGKYSVAPAAPGWVGWVALDIDAHPAAGSPELVARRLARARADRVLAGVWRALDCSAERHPLVMRSPGGGYHVWLPLTRGPSSANPEHTWPAAVARAWVERHLIAAGLELAPGVLEVYPSGRCLRAPCGRGMTLLRATQPSDPDSLGLVPWPGTMADARIDWRGERDALSTPVRQVVPMVRAFVEQWGAQRRTLTDWLGRPEATWDPAWGFLGWRGDVVGVEGLGEISPGEKKSGSAPGGQESRSQESDDVPGRLQAGGTPIVPAGQGRAGRVQKRKRSESPSSDEILPPSALEVDLPPDLAVGPLVRGRVFLEKVRKLLCEGVTEASTRHDAVLTLAFYWGATCGLSVERVVERLEAWCRAHPHQGSSLAARLFLATCVREGRHYVEHYAARWRFRGHSHAGGLASLTTADHAVIAAVDPRVAGEVAAILAWLAGRADLDGRIADPAQIATGLLARLCGDRRLDVHGDGKRRRATAFALVELERLGVLTLASNYRVGQRGRTWSCWYRFGSGELPRAVALPAVQWAELEQPIAVPKVPTLAIVEPSAPCPDIASAPIIEVRVVGERVVPEGQLRVLSDGARGVARTLLTLAPEVARPTAAPSARAAWFVRAYQLQPFTPGRLWSTDPALVIPFPDVEARRRMSRTQRLAWGGGGGDAAAAVGRAGGALAPVISLRAGADPSANTSSSPSSSPLSAAAVTPGDPSATSGDPSANAPSSTPPSVAVVARGLADRTAAPGPGRSVEALRAELAAEVGDEIAAALPIDVLEVACRAWGGFRGRGS